MIHITFAQPFIDQEKAAEEALQESLAAQEAAEASRAAEEQITEAGSSVITMADAAGNTPVPTEKKSGSEFRCFSGNLWDSGSAVVAGLFAIPDPTGQTQKTKTEKSKQKSIRRQQKPSQIISCSKHCQYHFMKDVGLERKPGIADTASGLGDTA